MLAVAYVGLFATVGVAVLQPWPLKLILDHVVLEKPLPRTLVFLNPLFAINSKLLLLLLSLSVLYALSGPLTLLKRGSTPKPSDIDAPPPPVEEQIISH